MPVNEDGISGDGPEPVPRVRSAGGGDECQTGRPRFSCSAPDRSAVSKPPQARLERNGDVPRPLFGFHAHQHAALALFAGLAQRLAQLIGRGDGLAGDLEDHVAGLEAEIGRGTRRIDLGDDDALLACRPLAPATGRGAAPGRRLLRPPRSDSARASRAFGNSPSVRLDRLLRAAADEAELDSRAGSHAADLAGEVARVDAPACRPPG